MDSKFWMGCLVGFLVGVIVTAIAIFLWFVPVRTTTTTPSGLPVESIERAIATAAPVAMSMVQVRD